MDEPFTIDYEETPDPAELALVRAGLDAFNHARAQAVDYRPFALFVRGAGGEIAGGLIGATYWGWLYVEILWLAEQARGQRLGSRLLQQAEREAVARGCHGAHLDTMDFQAPAFYERHGYAVFGRVEATDPRQDRVYLKKTLRGPARAEVQR